MSCAFWNYKNGLFVHLTNNKMVVVHYYSLFSAFVFYLTIRIYINIQVLGSIIDLPKSATSWLLYFYFKFIFAKLVHYNLMEADLNYLVLRTTE